MKILKYKGILFDDYAKTEDGCYWAEICANCVEKYHGLIVDDIDDGGTACGMCSIKGCSNDGEDFETKHYYIDFKPEFIEWVVNEN